jgi:hypothetical protein
MARVQRVILLNKPLKIRGFSIFQWVMLGISVGVGFWVSFSLVPQNIKFGNVPAGLVVFVCIVGAMGAFVTASEMKPMVWWKNNFLYRLKLVPTQFLPRPQPGTVYPDPSIIEPGKRDDDYYVR